MSAGPGPDGGGLGGAGSGGAHDARLVRLDHPADPVAWRDAARALLAAAVPPEAVIWRAGDDAAGGADDLFAPASGSDARPEGPGTPPARVPRAFLALVADVVPHRDEHRFALLYRVSWRLARGGERALLEDRTDDDVHALERMAKAVRRDRHKMTAFVRFRRLADGAEGVERYAAWFEPEHRICRSTADFFVRRFATMAFSIFTPDESVHWDTERLAFGPPAARRDAPDDEAMEALWCEYYASIFNPARLKVGAMRAEMPKKYWRNLPEAALIPALVRGAGGRTGAMLDAPGTSAPGYAVRAGLAGGSRRPDGADSGKDSGKDLGADSGTDGGAGPADAPVADG